MHDYTDSHEAGANAKHLHEQDRERRINQTVENLGSLDWSVDFAVDRDCDGRPEWYVTFTDPWGTEHREHVINRDDLPQVMLRYEERAMSEFGA